MVTVSGAEWRLPASRSSSSLSAISISETLASLSILTTTTTSGGTIPGPGALSGKAILALGKAALRGAEYLIIRRRLRVISSTFPHTNNVDIKGIERMYDDILELSRLGLYPDAIRMRVIQMLLIQIGSRQTWHLTKALNKWPPVEIQIFVSVLTSILDPLRLSLEGNGGGMGELVKAYQGSLATWESHSLAPFVDFLRELSESQGSISDAVLLGGVMEFLFRSYVVDFRDPLAETVGLYRKSILYDACNSFLSVTSASEHGLRIVGGHPFHILWPTRPRLPFTDLVHHREKQRTEVWNSCEKDVILWRIKSMLNMLSWWKRPRDDSILYDVCVDLLQFSGSSHMDSEVSFRALRCLHRLIVNFPSTREHIRQYLASSTPERFTEIISTIVIRLSHIISLDTPESNIYFLPRDKMGFKSRTVLHFVQYFTIIAEVDESFLSAIVASNVLGLMRPFLEAELQGHFVMAHREGDLSMVYDQSDSAILALIKEQGLKHVLLKVTDLPKASSFRKIVLCSAFNVFLHRKDLHGTHESPYAERNFLSLTQQY